ncbi:hypothetical protein COAQ111491_22175 [Comamonas aquatilis]
MFSLLRHKRQTEFWRDMWLILHEPTSKIQPIPSSLDQTHLPKQEAQQPKPQARPGNDRA